MEARPSRAARLKQLSRVTAGGAMEAAERSQELRQCANEINRGCADLRKCGTGILKLSSAAVKVAIHIGDKCRRAKDLVKHGEFGPWLKRNCPELSRRYAQQLMQASAALANTSHVTHLETIRELFMFCGIMQAPSAGERSAPMFFALAIRCTKPLKRLSIEAALALPQDQQLALKAALKPGHDVYEALPDPPPSKESIPPAG